MVPFAYSALPGIRFRYDLGVTSDPCSGHDSTEWT